MVTLTPLVKTNISSDTKLLFVILLWVGFLKPFLYRQETEMLVLYQEWRDSLWTDVSIDVPDTLDLSGLRASGQQPGEELLPEVAPPPLMTPDVEVKGILGSHGNEDDDSLYSPLLCQSVCHFCSFPSATYSSSLVFLFPLFLFPWVRPLPF